MGETGKHGEGGLDDEKNFSTKAKYLRPSSLRTVYLQPVLASTLFTSIIFYCEVAGRWRGSCWCGAEAPPAS